MKRRKNQNEIWFNWTYEEDENKGRGGSKDLLLGDNGNICKFIDGKIVEIPKE